MWLCLKLQSAIIVEYYTELQTFASPSLFMVMKILHALFFHQFPTAIAANDVVVTWVKNNVSFDVKTGVLI